MYSPIDKNFNKFNEEYNNCLNDKDYIKGVRPMTLEGCVVRISDIIGYIGKDIEDAVRLGKFNNSDIPNDIKEILGITNKDIMNNVILDIIEQSYNKPYIQMSDKISKLVVKLKRFNYENIYYKSNDEKSILEYEKMIFCLFDIYIRALNNNDTKNDIYLSYINNMNDEYNRGNSCEQKVIDFIAGMTDNYVKRQYIKYIG